MPKICVKMQLKQQIEIFVFIKNKVKYMYGYRYGINITVICNFWLCLQCAALADPSLSLLIINNWILLYIFTFRIYIKNKHLSSIETSLKYIHCITREVTNVETEIVLYRLESFPVVCPPLTDLVRSTAGGGRRQPITPHRVQHFLQVPQGIRCEIFLQNSFKVLVIHQCFKCHLCINSRLQTSILGELCHSRE